MALSLSEYPGDQGKGPGHARLGGHLARTTASEGIDENGCEMFPNRIFVGGIAFSTTELELKTYFQTFGAVRDWRIITDRRGVSKGYGFITFECQEDASRVKEQGTLYFNEKKLNIGPAIRKKHGGQFHKPASTTRKRSVDRSSDGGSFEPQSSAATSPPSAEVAPVKHVDLSQFSHETVTPMCTCPAGLAYAAPPGFVPVATTPTNASYYQHGETSNSPQLVYYPAPTQQFCQLSGSD
ncbi:protein boule-like [Oscarella lobularis]|uniref:protein boule-like n=1 Tax=Oscarella lobularis TaxID=121494 RepID=UPI00331381E0